MPLKTRKYKGRCKVIIEDELTVYQMADFKQQLLSKCEGASGVSLDLGNLTELDTAGVQFLLAWKKQLQTASIGFSVTALGEQAAQVLDTFNLGDAFKVAGERN